MASKIFLTILVVGILIIGAGAASLYFLHKENSKLSKELKNIKSKVNEMQSKANALDFLKRKKIESAEEDTKYKNILPSKVEKSELDFTSLVENFYREQANNITFKAVKKIEEKKTTAKTQTPTIPNIEKVSYEYTISGKLADIVTFVSLVESGGWFMKIEKFSIKRKEVDVGESKDKKEKTVIGECKLTVSGYFFKE